MEVETVEDRSCVMKGQQVGRSCDYEYLQLAACRTHLAAEDVKGQGQQAPEEWGSGHIRGVLALVEIPIRGRQESKKVVMTMSLPSGNLQSCDTMLHYQITIGADSIAQPSPHAHKNMG